MEKMELNAALALTGFALYQLHGAYTKNAPALQELREAKPGDFRCRQQLLDADVSIGGLAFIAGITASVFSRSYLPIGMVAVGFAWIAWYHHGALSGASPRDILGDTIERRED